MAFKMKGFNPGKGTGLKKNGNGKRGYDTGGFEAKEDAMQDGQDVEPTNKQKRQSRRQRNKYNKKALKNKPLSESRIKFFNEKINNPNTSKESVKEFKKLLKLNKRINK